jgi:hypothetical protein
VIVATVKAVREGWIPTADRAIIATRAYDVFTSHTPLVGQYSLAGEVTGRVTHSLGPMLFWLLALPARFGSPASMTWTMGALNTLAIVGVVALARRRGGVVLMFAAAVAVALMCQSLAAEALHDVWNPSAGLFPFTLLIFLCWSLACGEHRLLPLTALVASFVMQAHLMYLPPTLGLLAVGLAGLALPPRPRGRSLARWGAAALAVLAVCWSAPVVDQLVERPGNFTLVVQAATMRRATLGGTVGWHAVVRAVGWQPWWLHVPKSRWERKYDVRATPSSSTVRSCIALLGALLLALLIGAVRRRRDVASGALIGFVLCAALADLAASTPTPRLLSATLGYTMWWGSQVGMWVWLLLAWSGWLAVLWALGVLARADVLARARARARARALAHTRARKEARQVSVTPADALTPADTRAPADGTPGGTPTRSPRGRLVFAFVRALVCLAGVAGTAAVGSAVAATGQADEHLAVYRPTTALAASLDRVLARGLTVELLGNLNVATMPIKPALRYFLVRHHVRPLAAGSAPRLGTWYELYNRPYADVVYVNDGVRSPARRARLVDRVRFSDRGMREVVSLWLVRHEATSASRAASPHGSPRKPRRRPPRPAHG